MCNEDINFNVQASGNDTSGYSFKDMLFTARIFKYEPLKKMSITFNSKLYVKKQQQKPLSSRGRGNYRAKV